MQIKNARLENLLSSFGFSALLCAVWAAFSLFQAKALLQGFDLTGLLWLVYNATISVLFLIRVRPAAVSMDPLQWLVALITSFSGFLFLGGSTNISPATSHVATCIVCAALLLGIATAMALARSYDFLPALRGVKTGFLYAIVRHPMYVSSILIKIGYAMKHPSIYNIALLLIVAFLYDRRARYEEDVMARSQAYRAYLDRVKYRFIPGVY